MPLWSATWMISVAESSSGVPVVVPDVPVVSVPVAVPPVVPIVPLVPVAGCRATRGPGRPSCSRRATRSSHHAGASAGGPWQCWSSVPVVVPVPVAVVVAVPVVVVAATLGRSREACTRSTAMIWYRNVLTRDGR